MSAQRRTVVPMTARPADVDAIAVAQDAQPIGSLPVDAAETATPYRFTTGEIVVIIGGPYGVMASEVLYGRGRTYFHPTITIGEGQQATYVGEHPHALGDWHVVSIDGPDGKLYAPLSEGMFEAVTPRR